MSNVLSGVERAIMLKYLQDKLPKMVIKAISTKYIPSEQNLPKFDPLDLQESKYSILDQGIIFFTRNQTSRVIVDNAKICVFFYYNGRGLFFESTLRHVKNGFAIVIPDFIYKQDDIGNGVLQNLKCFLSNSDDESECKIYLTGLSEKHLEPFKETILSTMETKYSKNNVEVVII